MKTLKKVALSVLTSFALLSGAAMADSPLTSTGFSADYPEFEVVQKAAKDKNQTLTNEYAEFLTNADAPLGARAALVNALAWNFDGQKNAALFINYLENKNVSTPSTLAVDILLEKASPEEIALYAYLLAMDNYFEVKDALGWAQVAQLKKPNSQAINMIEALIAAQDAMDGDWCKVYTVLNDVRNNKELEQDFKAEAISSIFEYIGDYESYCKEKK